MSGAPLRINADGRDDAPAGRFTPGAAGIRATDLDQASPDKVSAALRATAVQFRSSAAELARVLDTAADRADKVVALHFR